MEPQLWSKQWFQNSIQNTKLPKMPMFLYNLLTLLRMILDLFIFRMVKWTTGKLNDGAFWLLNWEKIRCVRPCQVFYIVYRFKGGVSDPCRGCDFMVFPKCFEPLDVLLNPHWTIYSIDKQYAYFANTKKTLRDMQVKSTSFVFMRVFDEATLLARVTLDDFCRMYEILPEPKFNFVLLNSIMRTGGTLLAAALEIPGKTISLSEPEHLTNLACMSCESAISQEKIDNAIRSVMGKFATDVREGETLVLKARHNIVYLTPAIKRLFPKTKVIFNFRSDINKTMASIERMLGVTAGPFMFLRITKSNNAYNTNKLLKSLLPNAVSPPIFPDFYHMVRPQCFKDLVMNYIIAPVLMTQRHIQSGIPVHIVNYETFIKHPDDILVQLFMFMNLPPDTTARATAQNSSLTEQAQEGFKSGGSAASQNGAYPKAIPTQSCLESDSQNSAKLTTSDISQLHIHDNWWYPYSLLKAKSALQRDSQAGTLFSGNYLSQFVPIEPLDEKGRFRGDAWCDHLGVQPMFAKAWMEENYFDKYFNGHQY